ncbi:MAG: hypothetical protein N2441_10590 [Rhodocyclaceae bacterium]|nr:hypothetical protein [Rhodocyclaceae bacterium]
MPRSSHPRGIASDGRPPTPSNSGSEETRQRTASGSQAPSNAPAASTPPRVGNEGGGVNVTGTTRIDARARETSATAVGQGNTAGNRVGAIGGR